MYTLITVFLTVLMFAAAVAAQDNETEILRKQVNIPATDVIVKNKDAKLPAGNSLKIFLVIKRAGNEAETFDKWVKEWNQKEGGKNGKLEIVQTISEADIILTQFVTTRGEYVEEASVGVKTAPSYDELSAAGQPKNKLRVNAGTTYKSLNLPVYSYLIKREDTVWTIIYRNVETSVSGEEQLINPELILWREFKKEMKSR